MATVERLSLRAAAAAGQPISNLMHRALANPEMISLAAGFVDQVSLPVAETRAALEAVLSEAHSGQAALQYGTTLGYAALREALLDELKQKDGRDHGVSLDQVIVTAGSNQLLYLLVDTLCNSGDIILCAEPTYFVFLGMLRNIGVRAVGVATDEQGLIPEALEKELQRIDAAGEFDRVKALYVVSYYDNPTSTTLSLERRGPIVETVKRWSKKHAIRILEDAAYRELRYRGEDIRSLHAFDDDAQTVALTETFSKSFSPGIRVGWGFLPRDLMEAVANQKGNIDFGSPNFAQHVMAAVMRQGLFRPHVARLQEHYAAKLASTLESCQRHLASIPDVRWGEPQGGLYVWLRLPEEIDTGSGGELFDRAIDEGVLYVPGEYFYPDVNHQARNNTIRLSFGVQSVERIDQGIAALAKAIHRVLG